MNKYRPHVYVIPEDDRDRQIADGFVLHPQVNAFRIQVVAPAGGWGRVRDVFRDEYISLLRQNAESHVVMLIDFDDRGEERKAVFESEIPEELKNRVFVVGSKYNPESLKQSLKLNYEEIGQQLADDCAAGTTILWDKEELAHNDAERRRLDQFVKSFLF